VFLVKCVEEDLLMKDTSNTKSCDTHVGGVRVFPSFKKTRLLDLPLVTRVRFWTIQVNLRAFTIN
jgi:hypothetical protein